MKAISILTFLALGTSCFADVVVLASEHTDIGINFNASQINTADGPWRLTARDEDNTIEFLGMRAPKPDPERVILSVGLSAQTEIPDDSDYSFLGPEGNPVWILPQGQDPELLYLGISTENKSFSGDWISDGVEAPFLARGIPSGVFELNRVTLKLESFSGPGEFALYFIDSFSNVTVYMNTGDGLTTADSRNLSPGNHTHFNWAFTAPGDYTLGFRASGTLLAGSEYTESDLTTFHFQVIPEPASAVLCAVGFTLITLARPRKANQQPNYE